MGCFDDLFGLFDLDLLVRFRHLLQITIHCLPSVNASINTHAPPYYLFPFSWREGWILCYTLLAVWLVVFIIQMLGFDLRRASQLHRFSHEYVDLGGVGSGGFAEVRLVRGKLDQREYAAKVVRIKPSTSSEEAEERLFRALTEPRAHTQLTHPNILRYHGCWIELEGFSQQERLEMQEEESPIQSQFEMVLMNESLSSDGIVFESASDEPAPLQQQAQQERKRQSRKIGDGSQLSDYKQVRLYLLSEVAEMDLSVFLQRRSRQRKGGPLSPTELMLVYRMGLEILSGLGHLHARRIIHRDIKLHNIVVGRDGRCKLIDFGLAKRVKHWKTSIQQQPTLISDCDQERFSSEVGTKLFSSPEQASSEKYDYRTDIYSLAVVIVLLFHSYTTAHEQRELLEKVRKRNLEEMAIPQGLKGLLYKCLGGENERPSLSELKNCMKDLMKDCQMMLKETPSGKQTCGHSIKCQQEEQSKGKMVEVKES